VWCGCGSSERTVYASSYGKDKCADTCATAGETHVSVEAPAADLPANAQPGDCFAKVYIPPQTETCTERVMVREATETFEVVPARYEWVEEKVLVKDGCKTLEAVPAEYKWEEKQIQVQPGRREWVMKPDEACKTADGRPLQSDLVMCLVEHPPMTRTVREQCIAKPACVREVEQEAQYQTVRVQKLVEPASTKRVEVPAQYEDVTKTVVVAPGRFEWQRVVCELDFTPENVNAIKGALESAGYDAGPRDGTSNEPFWTAVRDYQKDNDLAVGGLTYATTARLGVEIK
jgi:hypothetical protein